MEELKTKAWSHNVGSHFSCMLCGGDHRQNMAAVSLVMHRDWKPPNEISDSILFKEMSDAMLGDVCRDCIEAGPQGAAERMLDYVEYLRQGALKLETLAGRVARITEWASVEDLREAERRVGEDRRGGPANEELDGGMPF